MIMMSKEDKRAMPDNFIQVLARYTGFKDLDGCGVLTGSENLKRIWINMNDVISVEEIYDEARIKDKDGNQTDMMDYEKTIYRITLKSPCGVRYYDVTRFNWPFDMRKG